MAETEVRDVRDIPAPLETVWALTLDVEAWPRISPATMTEVTRLDDGPLAVGSAVRVRQPRQRARVWRVTHLRPTAGEVVADTEPHVFAWETTILGVTMEAVHALHPIPRGCRNVLSVRLRGRGARLLGWVIGGAVGEAVGRENAAFAEAATATG